MLTSLHKAKSALFAALLALSDRIKQVLTMVPASAAAAAAVGGLRVQVFHVCVCVSL
jgi:hypothetical protein